MSIDGVCEEFEGCKLDVEKKISDEELFKQPPPKDDCPICFLRIPSLVTGRVYKSCCGKVICSGCSYAPVYDNQGNIVAEKKCPYCRTPWPSSDEENITRRKKRMEANDAIAMFNLGYYYYHGSFGFPQDRAKALELWHRAGDLGYSRAYGSIGNAYEYGQGVEVDKKKAVYYYELAAIGGSVPARFNLGSEEWRAGNMKRAMKHWMIAVRGGYDSSLEKIKELYADGSASKEDYTAALRLYQEYLGEIKSVQRDKAAEAHERYRYY